MHTFFLLLLCRLRTVMMAWEQAGENVVGSVRARAGTDRHAGACSRGEAAKRVL